MSRRKKPAPPDRYAVKGFKRIVERARRAGLLSVAVDDEAVILHPSVQVEIGDRAKILEASGLDAEPSTEASQRAWDAIMAAAAKWGLILTAYAGTCLLATPELQRRTGHREGVLSAHSMEEHPDAAQKGVAVA